MESYSKISRRIISHPKTALDDVRNLITRHIRKSNTCPRCWSIGWQHIHNTNASGVRTYRCVHCQRSYSELFGTPLYRSKIPVSKWCEAIIEWSVCTGGLSWASLGRKIGVSRKSWWKITSKIRTILLEKTDIHPLSGEVEADEAWFGRKENQEIVMGMVQRSPRKTSLFVVPNVKERTLWSRVEQNLVYGSRFFTDSRIAYISASIRYRHYTTNHSHHEFAKTETTTGIRIHSNTIEQTWWALKWVIRTIHHGVSRKYRLSYLNEYIIRSEAWKRWHLYYYILALLLIPMFRTT